MFAIPSLVCSVPAADPLYSAQPSLSYEQVPQHKQSAEGRRAVEDHLGRAPSLRRPLELLVSAADIFRCVERVLHQLFNMRRLYLEVACERRLQLRDFDERLLCSAVSC